MGNQSRLAGPVKKWEEFAFMRTIRQMSDLCMVRDGQVRFEVEGEYAMPYKGIDSAAVWPDGVLLSPGGVAGGIGPRDELLKAL